MGETLNAVIESARAGEAGKGFSVVAQEVGNLATSTKSSLRNVNDVIVRLQTGTADVPRFMNENAQQFQKRNQVIVETVQCSGIFGRYHWSGNEEVLRERLRDTVEIYRRNIKSCNLLLSLTMLYYHRY